MDSSSKEKVNLPIQVILADDHHVVRQGIRYFLERFDDVKIAGEASNGVDVLELLKAGVTADIVITDINMPLMGGIELLENLQLVKSSVKVMILSMAEDEEFLLQAFKAGASGFLLKSVSPDELIFALRHISRGNQYICSDITSKMVKSLIKKPMLEEMAKTVETNFTTKEIEVLALLAEGLTNQEIADRLFASKRTVEGYRETMITKAGVRNTVALIRYAVANGIIT